MWAHGLIQRRSQRWQQKLALLAATLLFFSMGAWCYTDTFSTAPSGNWTNHITTGTAEIGLDYQGTSPGLFAWGGASQSMDADAFGDPDTIVITSRAGGAFTFHSIDLENLTSAALTISGVGPQPFTIHVPGGSPYDTYAAPGGGMLVTSVSIASDDLWIDFDNVDVTIGDTTAPTLQSFARQTPVSEDTNADTLVFRATFDEGVQYVTTDDFGVTGTTATVTNVNAVSASVYDLTVSGGDLAGYDGVAGIDLDAGQNIADLSDNALPDGEPTTDQTYSLDNTDPTDPTPSSSSHTVSVWDNDNTVDILISGASDTGSGVDGFEVEWDQSATWTPTETKEQEEAWAGATFTATSDGDWYFHIATVDNVGNWTSTQHVGPFQIDTTPPSVPTELEPGSGEYITDTSPLLRWAASTDPGGSGIRDTDAYRVVVTGPVNRDTYVSDTDYNPTLSEGTFTWKVYARDNAGNSSGYTADATLYIDATQPDVTIDQAGGQTDPTNDSDVRFAVVFDEPINDATFTGADVSVGGTAPTGLVIVTEVAPNDDTTFEVSIAATGDGTVVPTISAGGIEDYAGNSNTASTSTDNSVSYDGSKPSVTMEQAGGQVDPANASLVDFTAVFDEPIDDATFTGADVSVGGTATTGAMTVIQIPPFDDTTFRISIVVTGDGTVVPTIPAGGVEDPFGNTNNASTSTDNSVTVDTEQPVVLNVTVGDLVLSDGDTAVGLDVLFSEPMDTGVTPILTFFPNVDMTLTLDTSFWLFDDHFYASFDITDAGVDVDSVTVDVTSAQDPAGNPQIDYAPEHEFEIDTENPTVTMAFDDSMVNDADAGSIRNLIMTFSEPMDSRQPSLLFSPDVAGTGTLSLTSQVWESQLSNRCVFNVSDLGEPFNDVDALVTNAADLVGNWLVPDPTFTTSLFAVDTENPTVMSTAVSDSLISNDDVGSGFIVTVNYSESMNQAVAPAITFAPDVSMVLALESEGWIDTDSYRLIYNVLQIFANEAGIDIDASGAVDAQGNAQTGTYTAVDLFDIAIQEPDVEAILIITPMGAVSETRGKEGEGAPVRGFLDRCLMLRVGEPQPMAGLCPLHAIYTIGEAVTGACSICSPDGCVLRNSYVHIYIYSVDISARPELRTLETHWTIHCDTNADIYGFGWDTSGHTAGYYDIYLGFEDGSSQMCRIQLLEPEVD